MNLKTVVQFFVSNPDIVFYLLAVIVALLIKAKVLTEKDIATARDMLAKQGKAITDVTDETRLTFAEAKKIQEAVKSAVPDTTRKKVQRAARALLRGWLR